MKLFSILLLATTIVAYPQDKVNIVRVETTIRIKSSDDSFDLARGAMLRFNPTAPKHLTFGVDWLISDPIGAPIQGAGFIEYHVTFRQNPAKGNGPADRNRPVSEFLAELKDVMISADFMSDDAVIDSAFVEIFLNNISSGQRQWPDGLRIVP